MEETKILLIGKNGKAYEGGSSSELFPESVKDLYETVGVPLQINASMYGLVPVRTFLRHTDKESTKYTGLAVLAGAFNIGYPESQQDLDNHNLSSVDIQKEPLFNIDRAFSLKAHKKHGLEVNIDYWLKYPTDSEHEGETIEPYESLKSRTMEGIRKSINRMVYNDDKFGVIVMHDGNIETAMIELINSGRELPVKKITEIGGPMGMGEFAELTIDQKAGFYTATLNLRNNDYMVDLKKLYQY